jgi:Txe/YoeB family toxin of Txe-Axe toxin-antitoxin module
LAGRGRDELAGSTLKRTDSRRIIIQHRLVYQVLTDEHAVKVLRMWTHYE